MTPLERAKTRVREFIATWPDTRWSRNRPILEITGKDGAVRSFTVDDLETLLAWTTATATATLIESLDQNNQRLTASLRLANEELRRRETGRARR